MEFNDKVYEEAKKIPCGKVSTYKDIAERLECKAYRAVGNALNKNCNKSVPCHRIVKSDGSVGGFRQGIEKKIIMLEKEGIEVEKGIIDLRKYGFKL